MATILVNDRVEEAQHMPRAPSRMDRIDAALERIDKRIYNGLAAEIRREVDKSIASLRNVIIGILVGILLALAGIVVEGRLSANAATAENMKNYKAIMELDVKVERHIIQTTSQ